MTRAGWQLARDRRRNGNPMPAPLPSGPSAFERKLKELGLPADGRCLESAVLVAWIKRSHGRVWIPEEILERLGLAQKDTHWDFGIAFSGPGRAEHKRPRTPGRTGQEN
jgi:hypothetical protein